MDIECLPTTGPLKLLYVQLIEFFICFWTGVVLPICSLVEAVPSSGLQATALVGYMQEVTAAP